MPADAAWGHPKVNPGFTTPEEPFELKRPAWQGQANCHPDVIPHVWQEFGAHPVDLFFPESGRPTQRAREAIALVCGPCPVKEACDAHALLHEEYGVWAEVGAETRRKARQRAGVTLASPHVDPDSRRVIGTWIPPSHGTQARYARHRRDGTEPCQLCIEAHSEGNAPKAAARWAATKATDTPKKRSQRLQAEKDRRDKARVALRRAADGG